MRISEGYIDNRKIALKSLVGSCNYNTANKNSDKDFKVFTLPTFSDLYEGFIFKKNVVGDKEDYDIHDIRRLEKLLFKSNVNYTEVLFSDYLTLGSDLHPKSIVHIEELLKRKEDIASMNLPYFFRSSFGMFNERFKYLTKGTKDTKELVEKFGYDTKQASQGYRILDFLIRYHDRDFKDFKGAIYYNDEEREQIMDIKEGRYGLPEFSRMIDKKAEEAKLLEEIYVTKDENLEVREFLKETLKKIILIEL